MHSQVELTNMCMIVNRKQNKVLVQERIKSWKGICFPGGHVEPGEGILASTIREIKEETGLTVSNLRPCGLVHWYNEDTGERYFVFNFKTETFSGELLTESNEGRNFWVSLDELETMTLSPGLRERLPMFLEESFSEAFGLWSERRVSGGLQFR